MKVLDIQLDQIADGSTFSSTIHVKSSGALALVERLDLRSSARGRFNGGSVFPASFHHQNIDGKTNRKVDVVWTGADTVVTAEPSLRGKLGDPPATRAQRLEATDPLTALMRTATAKEQTDLCRTSSKIYDGKQRYDLDFMNRIPARPSAREKRLGLVDPVHCNVRFREVAGFKRRSVKERDQALKRQIIIGFAKVGPRGPWVVSYLDAETPLGHATIELERVRTFGSSPR